MVLFLLEKQTLKLCLTAIIKGETLGALGIGLEMYWALIPAEFIHGTRVSKLKLTCPPIKSFSFERETVKVLTGPKFEDGLLYN